MTVDENYKIISNDFFDLIIKYNGNPASLDRYKNYSVQMMNEGYAVIYVPVAQISTRLISEYGYSSIPHCYALTSEQSLDASGVTKLRRLPGLNLRGNGVVIGIIDTGIDYTNPVFFKKDGTTKILAIWDQSIASGKNYPGSIFPPYYGTEYTSDQINEALKNENPYQLVPSKDENGHGTMLAGVAAGSEKEDINFSGVAPDADLIVVKLKPAKKNLTDFFSIPSDKACYQENDIIWAIQYVVDSARRLGRPLVICIALGTSQGAHDDSGSLDTIASIIADFPGIAILVSAGNEGNAGRHFFSAIKPSSTPIPIEVNVGEDEYGFTMEFWGNPPTIYTLDILSPTGEYVPVLSESIKVTRKITFVFEATIINIDLFMIEEETGKQVILLRFIKPTPGVWKFQVYGKGDLQGEFHIWLPVGNFITRDTYFIQSNPYTTITSPGNSIVPITITAYNSNVNSLYQNSGRGYSTSHIINPDIAAPGVNLQCPALDHSFTSITGTGAAAAHASGIAALILEWSIVNGNFPDLDSVGLKKFLNRGAKRSSNLLYPNRDWGYGIIDLYSSFNMLKTDLSK